MIASVTVSRMHLRRSAGKFRSRRAQACVRFTAGGVALQGRIQDFWKGGGAILGLQAKKGGVQDGVQLWAQCWKAYIVAQKGGQNLLGHSLQKV